MSERVYQESEIVDLLMLVFLFPIMAASVRAIQLPGKHWFVAGYFAIAAGFVLTVVEGYVLPDTMNLLEHVTNAIAGTCFALAALSLFHASRARDGAS